MSERDTLLISGQIFELLSRVFAYPDSDIQAYLNSGNLVRQISKILQNLPRRNELEKFVANLDNSLQELNEKSSGLDEEYTYLFLRNVLVPPNEGRYTEQAREGLALSTLSDLASFYAAFGLRVGEKAGELADHITVELEFLSTLYLKEAHALEKGWQEKAGICGDARRKFLKEHIGWWFKSFNQSLHEKARLSFYPSLADFTQAFLSLGPEPASKN